MKIWGIVEICIALALIIFGIISLVKGIIPTGGIVFFLIALYLLYSGYRDITKAKKVVK